MCVYLFHFRNVIKILIYSLFILIYSIKRTSRLSNIIDNLRTTKEKEVLGQPGSGNSEAIRKNSLDTLFGADKKSSGLPPVPSLVGKKSSQATSNSVTSPPYPSSATFSGGSSSSLPSASSDAARAVAEKLYRDSQGFPQQISADTRHAIRSSLDAARAQAFNNTFKNSFNSFSALEDDQNKGKRMLENLEMMNGIMDPYGLNAAKKASLMEVQHSSSSTRKADSSQSQNRIKTSSASLPLSSASSSITVPHASFSSSSRPSSRQPSKQSGVSSSSLNYPSGPVHSSSSSSSRTSASSNNNSTGGSNSIAGNSSSSAMFQAAPSAALAAAHMELNAVAANLFAFQHMYGMQDPYMMKTLMSNPVYLQRMMEYQKQAMDPLMLRQLEMFEAAANAEKNSKSAANNKDRDQRAAMNAQSFLWQAQAASFLQHQQMQQLQQLQLHHHQQLQHQVAAVRDREAFAAIMAGKGPASLGAVNATPSANTVKSNSGSISTGQSAKSVLAAAASSSASSSTNKRPRPSVPSSLPEAYSREVGPSLEKKSRSSHPGTSASHLNNHSNYHSSSSSSSSAGLSSSGGSSSSAAKYLQNSSRSGGSSNGGMGGSSGGSGSSSNSASSKHRGSSSNSGSSSTTNHHHQLLKQHEQQLLQQHLDLPTALQLSAAAAAGHNVWGFPGLAAQASSADIARMSRYFERPAEVPPPPASSAGSSSASSHHAPEAEPSGAEVLDLSVKPRTGKT